VTLEKGKNKIKAVAVYNGKEYVDEIKWDYQSEKYVVASDRVRETCSSSLYTSSKSPFLFSGRRSSALGTPKVYLNGKELTGIRKGYTDVHYIFDQVTLEKGINSDGSLLPFAVRVTSLRQIEYGRLAPVRFIPVVRVLFIFRSKVISPFRFRAGTPPRLHIGTAKSNIFHR